MNYHTLTTHLTILTHVDGFEMLGQLSALGSMDSGHGVIRYVKNENQKTTKQITKNYNSH